MVKLAASVTRSAARCRTSLPTRLCLFAIGKIRKGSGGSLQVPHHYQWYYAVPIILSRIGTILENWFTACAHKKTKTKEWLLLENILGNRRRLVGEKGKAKGGALLI